MIYVMVCEIWQNLCSIHKSLKNHVLYGCHGNKHNQKNIYKKYDLDTRFSFYDFWKGYKNFDFFKQNLEGIFGVIHQLIRDGIPYMIHLNGWKMLYSVYFLYIYMSYPWYFRWIDISACRYIWPCSKDMYWDTIIRSLSIHIFSGILIPKTQQIEICISLALLLSSVKD